MLVRVRSNMGVWRVQVADAATATVADVLAGIRESRPNVVYEKPLSADPACLVPLDPHTSLAAQGILQNGAMVHCRVDPATTVDVTVVAAFSAAENDGTTEGTTTTTSTTTTTNNMRRVIDKDGTIKLVPSSETVNAPDNGFRKGMLALRDMKMHWTRE